MNRNSLAWQNQSCDLIHLREQNYYVKILFGSLCLVIDGKEWKEAAFFLQGFRIQSLVE